ncbi:hypothetical protein TrCOL_g6260 [Triparma columacea]|uniref:PPM-type phosphatase domain-containing protein n=1 Tax=Triparma columacea TaxID=722753 RepID=A0A9W7G7S1_9STRA|nr:hypothetical protein TrCOL_g6260 [Triparma columacea]
MQGVTTRGVLGSTDTLNYGSACCPSHKGEDFVGHSISADKQFASFAVFDGHGGSDAATVCAEIMCSSATKIYDEKGLFGEEDIKEIFGVAAEKTSKVKDNSGTTATLAFVKFDASGEEASEAEITLAWVGDSRGIICHEGRVAVATEDHKLTNPAERARIMKAIDNKIMILTPEPSRKPGAVPLPPMTVNLDESGHKLDEERQAEARGEEEDVTVKDGRQYFAKSESTPKQTTKMHVYEGKSRSGRDISELTDLEDITVKGGNQYKPGAVINPQESAKSAAQKSETNAPENSVEGKRGRRKSFIAQRISRDGRQRGPWCLFSGENGTSLAVTRSLGDADAARCCISVPEIISFKVKRGEDSRIILCSDGVWDTLSSTQVLKRCARRQPAAASKRTCGIVKERRYNNGLGRDDITVFIIDIFPLPSAPGCAPGACSVM